MVLGDSLQAEQETALEGIFAEPIFHSWKGLLAV